jgi:hypothetical protein
MALSPGLYPCADDWKETAQDAMAMIVMSVFIVFLVLIVLGFQVGEG